MPRFTPRDHGVGLVVNDVLLPCCVLPMNKALACLAFMQRVLRSLVEYAVY